MSALPALRICFLCCAISTAMWAQNTASKLAITMAGEPWTLAFNAKDFSIKTNGMQPDGRAYLRAENTKNMMILSVYLERVQGVATEADCQKTQKERLDQKVGYKREKIEARQSAGMEIVEYTIPEFDGAPVQQRNLFACIAKDDFLRFSSSLTMSVYSQQFWILRNLPQLGILNSSLRLRGHVQSR